MSEKVTKTDKPKKNRKPRTKTTGTPRERYGMRLSKLAAALDKLNGPAYATAGTGLHITAACEALDKAIGAVQALPADWRPRSKRQPTPEQVAKMRERLATLTAKLAEAAA